MAQSTARFERPAEQATEPRAKQETRSILFHSLVVDSTFENIAIVVVSLLIPYRYYGIFFSTMVTVFICSRGTFWFLFQLHSSFSCRDRLSLARTTVES